MGFPADYRLPDMHLPAIYKAIGNTVAVPVVRRIAEKLMYAMSEVYAVG
jgi:site-specific DNA-cytosine methylase